MFKINISKITLLFSLYFLILTFIIYKYQLLGLTDHGFWLSAFYNVVNSSSLNTSLMDQHTFLYYPFIYIFSIFGFFIDNPIIYAYLLSYFTYLAWFITSFLLLNKKTTIKNITIYFIFFFSSATILFYYNLNYNGYESVFLAIPFLILSYNYALIKTDYKKSILLYIPLLLIKSNFWLILVFLFIAISIKEKKLKYLIFSMLTLISMLLYFKFVNQIMEHNNSINLMNMRFAHIFDVNSLQELIFNIINIHDKLKKVILIITFFIPFSFLINFKKMSKRDMIIFLVLIFPTFSYSFLSNHVAMSYWVHEHYSTPILAIIFIAILKYPAFSKFRIFGYFMTNILLFIMILSLKQPWQYKYYQDEDQLKQEIIPSLSLKSTDHVLADDRTGIYFVKSQVNYIEFQDDNKTNISYKNIIINMRYIYSSENLKFNKPKNIVNSYDYISSKNFLNFYKIIYMKYPFIVYSKENIKNIKLSKNLLTIWDKKTIKSNKWIQTN